MPQLDRSLDVLEFLAERGEAGAGEVSQELALPRASVYRLLHTLEERGYIARAPRSKLFRLGLAIHALAAQADASLVVSLAAPALADLCAKTGETSNLGVLSGGRFFYGASRDGPNVPRMPATVGEEIEPHATAIGKVILSAMPARDRLALLGPEPYVAFTDHTLTTAAELEREFAETAERGYAVDEGEIAVGAVCIAAAILDDKGYPVAALSISGINARLEPPDPARSRATPPGLVRAHRNRTACGHRGHRRHRHADRLSNRRRESDGDHRRPCHHPALRVSGWRLPLRRGAGQRTGHVARHGDARQRAHRSRLGLQPPGSRPHHRRGAIRTAAARRRPARDRPHLELYVQPDPVVRQERSRDLGIGRRRHGALGSAREAG